MDSLLNPSTFNSQVDPIEDARNSSSNPFSSSSSATAPGAEQRWLLFEEARSSDAPCPPSPLKESEDSSSCNGQRNPEESDISLQNGLIGAGLENLGNTCFLNSVLQCLIYTRPINNYIINSKHKSVCKEDIFCAMCALEDLVKEARSASGLIIAPYDFAYNIERISDTFMLYEQGDAHEFFMCLINALDRCCTICEPTSEAHLISRMFYGRLRNEVTCAVCQHRFETYDPFINLSLNINKVASLVDRLFEFTAVEKMEGDNGYTCVRCNKSVVASKQVFMDELPEVLVIQLMRFENSSNYENKIINDFHFGVSLDLAPFMASGIKMEKKCSKYSLYAVLVHSGLSTTSGHYYCFVHTSGNWHEMDDSWVEKVNENTVLEEEAYLLFYVQDCGESCSTTSSSSLSRSDIKQLTSGATTSSLQVEAPQAELSFSRQTRPRYGLSQEDLDKLCSEQGEKKAPATAKTTKNPVLRRVDSKKLKRHLIGKRSKWSPGHSGKNRAEDNSSRFQKG